MKAIDLLYSVPLSIQLDVTNACNLKCLYCYASSGEPRKDELSFDEISNLLKHLADIGVFSIVISGGEPFLRPDICDIIRSACEYDMRVTVNTNGTLLTQEMIKKLRTATDHCKTSNKLTITINVEGASAHTHDAIRGGEGSFNMTMKGVNNLIKSKIPLRLIIITVAQKQNLKEIPEITKIASKLNAYEHRIISLAPFGRGMNSYKRHALTPTEWQQVFEFRKTCDIEIPVQFGHELFFILSKDEFSRKARYLPACEAGKRSCVISSNGNVYPCKFFYEEQFLAGNIRKEPFFKIWRESKILNFFRNFRIKDDWCKDCVIREACMGGCRALAYNLFKDIEKADPRCRWFM